jgi:formylglycine-generating enzyme required for sulfatase activity
MARHLAPFYEDQDAVRDRLRHLVPKHAWSDWLQRDGVWEAVETLPGLTVPPPSDPTLAGAAVLVLGDLGGLAAKPQLTNDWAGLGATLRIRGARPVALIPGPRSRWNSALDAWERLTWERVSPEARAGTRESRARGLFKALSPALRIDRGLLRDMRLFLGPDHADAGTEVDVWQHSDMLGTDTWLTGTIRCEWAQALRQELASEPVERRRAILAIILRWRVGLPDLWMTERLGMMALQDGRGLFSAGEEQALWAALAAAERRFSDAPPARQRFAAEWLAAARTTQEGDIWRRPEAAEPLARMWQRAIGIDAGIVHPTGFRPKHLARRHEPAVACDICQIGSELTIRQTTSNSPPGSAASPLGTIRSHADDIFMEPDSLWISGIAPAFAEEWGCDKHGPWVSFSVRGPGDVPVTQRMRWIPPGRFLMGSPEGEPGHWVAEGPQHEVTIAAGFWLFDTPVTQAMWQAVMGGNPSRFKSPDRPVELVSWDEAQEFIVKLNAEVPGLDLALPSEAQWEYACRARKTASIYEGELQILGDSNAPSLDPIAWYSGNAGIGFELDNGYDSSGWPKKQFEHSRAGTHPVALKRPNAWGLHDMLGNVWEWCEDAWHGSYDGAPTDGSAWQREGAEERVLRGGSWRYDARYCRSVSRDARVPGSRYDDFGFRCARGQAGAEPEGTRRLREAERRSAAALSGAAVAGRLRVGAPEACRRLPAGPFTLRSDCEAVTLAPLTLPDWASAVGRDEHGLWTEIEVARDSAPPVAQRLRWMSPGRFQMGSPEDEAERFDDEGPPHWVTLAKGFWLFDTAVTQALWQAVTGRNPSRFKGDETLPVEQVSWDDAQRFLRKINGTVPGLGLRLPSEAEWEYACRAGTEMPFSFGATITPEQVNYNGGYSYAGGAKGLYRQQTLPVGSLLPNAWGLYEMHGNVWEWCADAWHDNYEGAPLDGSVWQAEGAEERVLRGGSWLSDARGCRSAYRNADDPGSRGDDFGFRCARGQDGAEAGVEAAIPPGGAAESGLDAGRSGKSQARKRRGKAR